MHVKMLLESRKSNIQVKKKKQKDGVVPHCRNDRSVIKHVSQQV